jgi:tellurite resistance protein TerC
MTESLQTFPPWAWVAFIFFIAAMMGVDLGAFRKESREDGMREALGWCTVWILLALRFNLVVLPKAAKHPAATRPPH